MNIVDIVDIKLKIYEFVTTGKITERDQDNLLSVLEMKTRDEYRKRAFKRRFKFHPDKNDPNKGTINVDGETIRVNIGKSEHVLTRDDGSMCRMPRQSAHVIIGGEIILDSRILMKLKNKDRIDAAVYHEVGHNKFHGVTQDPKDYRKTTNSDASLTEDIVKEIVDSTDKELRPRYHTKHDLEKHEKYIASLQKYLIKKMNNGELDMSKQKLRTLAIQMYKEHERSGHTNWKEFEADRYAANKTSRKAVKTSTREYTKKSTERLKKEHPESIIKKINEHNKSDLKHRSRVLDDKELVKYKDAYK